ncbi:MAG: FtsW/RodA/SpoVE family cell cycle protein [Bacteroidales bacterium]|nr:FtsW/RodA/SpoVE family cell cycle protein [Bacteroidales bacterium]
MAEQKKKGIARFFELLPGDRVIWIVVILLAMISILSVFSSSSLLALETGSSRMSIVGTQMIVALVGILVIVAVCMVKNMKVFQWLSQWGFAVSFLMLVMLVAHIKLPFARAAQINGAWRILTVFGLQIHVYEVIKVLMVMYLAWAVDALRTDNFALLNHIVSKYEKMRWMDTEFWKKMIYIYLPVILTTVLMMDGGTSSALFFAAIMALIIFVGGVRVGEILILAAIVGLWFGTAIGVYKNSGKIMPFSGRVVTAIGRLDTDHDRNMEIILTAPRASKEFQTALDKERQQVGALLAIKDGGWFGKGAGRSNQRYIVAVIFGDYMYSFIIEEYGIIGGIIVMLLYLSLLARGALISKNCSDYYGKVCAGSLCLLITAQAFMHILINVHLAPQTGQTLPMISHGTSSYLVFSFAFGVILSISRIVQNRLKKEEENAAPLIVTTPAEPSGDSVKDGLEELEDLENE